MGLTDNPLPVCDALPICDARRLLVKPNLKDAATLVDLTQGPEDDDDTPLVVAPKTPTKTTPKEKFQSPGPVKQTPPQRVQDEVMFIGTTTPTKPPSAVSSTKNPKKVSKKSLVAKSQPPKKMEPPLKPASKSAPQRLSPNKVAFSLSPEMVARLPQRKQSPFGFDVNYSSDDDIGTLRKRKREKQRKKKNIDQGTDDRKPAAKPRAPAPSFGEQVSLAGRPRPREFVAARPDKKKSPTPRTKGSPPAASRDSNTKSDASLNLRDTNEGQDEKSHATTLGGIASEYENSDKVKAFLEQIMSSDDDPPYSYEEYSELLLQVEDSIQLPLDAIEYGRGVAKANKKVSNDDSSNQKSAMYGSLEPKMIKVRDVLLPRAFSIVIRRCQTKPILFLLSSLRNTPG